MSNITVTLLPEELQALVLGALANITEVQADIASVGKAQEDFSAVADGAWMLINGFLVFFMHCGFAMLETGAVQSKNAVNILFKNVMTVSIGAVGYWITGYAFAYGTANENDSSSKFIGTGNYGMDGLGYDSYAFWFFQMVFAATCATIVSGAVAERTKLEAYFLVALYLVMFTYPVVSHWVWSGTGWLTAFPANGIEDTLFYGDADDHSCGMIDFAGSSVVHLVGGTTGLVGAIFVGPRMGRFETLPNGKYGKVLPMPAHSLALCAIGTFILWFGWYGFNCGSTLVFSNELAAIVAVNTSLSPAMAVLTGSLYSYVTTHHFDLGSVLNCTLAGLVGITAGCAVVKPWHAIIVGIISALIYLGSSSLLKKLKIDDPLDAVPVHGFNGIWGTLVPGIFGTSEFYTFSYGCAGNNQGKQFATQLIGVLAIIGWTVLTTVPLFFVLKRTIGLRVSIHAEEEGLDASEHGASAYELGQIPVEVEESTKNIKAAAKSKGQDNGTVPGIDEESVEDVKLTTT